MAMAFARSRFTIELLIRLACLCVALPVLVVASDYPWTVGIATMVIIAIAYGLEKRDISERVGALAGCLVFLGMIIICTYYVLSSTNELHGSMIRTYSGAAPALLVLSLPASFGRRLGTTAHRLIIENLPSWH